MIKQVALNQLVLIKLVYILVKAKYISE
ncbi:uncharacterized protein METZ01_LOCUS123807 [marine metagenome]|uniref:Uncharacterized protein n=1 Tax=marine metagenome TaxID=408172 RepID=A0A381Y3A2_9ZZZZ